MTRRKRKSTRNKRRRGKRQRGDGSAGARRSGSAQRPVAIFKLVEGYEEEGIEDEE